jgi:hypothetical protein
LARHEFDEPVADLGKGARLFANVPPRFGEEPGRVELPTALFHYCVASPTEHWLKGCAKPKVVVCGAQMERRPHQGSLDDLPIFDRSGKILAAEVGQPRPQANVGCHGKLGLQANQTLDGREDRQWLALQKHLTRQRGSVEFTQLENAVCHCFASLAG